MGSKAASNSEGLSASSSRSPSRGLAFLASLNPPLRAGLRGRGLQFVEGELRQELLRGHVVVIAAVGPEQLGEIGDLAQRLGVHALRMTQNLFQQRLLPQAPNRILIVVDRIDRDRRLRQPVGQRLLVQAERLEALGLELHESGGADAVHQRRVFRGNRRASQKEKECVRKDYLFLYGIAVIATAPPVRAARAEPKPRGRSARIAPAPAFPPLRPDG